MAWHFPFFYMMKRRSVFPLLLVLLSVADVPAQIQSEEPTLCEELRQTGRVAIQQDPRLEALLSRNHKIYNAASRKFHGMQPGHYSLSVYAGNQQQASRDEAFKLQGIFNDYDSELKTIVFFDTPFWRLWVGDFSTVEEATAAMRALKKKFPAYGKEMVIKKIPG